MNKVLIRLYVPEFEEQFDVWIPLAKKIYKVTDLLVKGINDFYGGYYTPKNRPLLYDKITAKPYNENDTVKESGIKNSTEIIMI